MPAPTFLNVLRSIPVAIPGVEFTVDSGRLNRSQDILKQHGADLRNAVAKAEAPDAVSWSVTVPGSARGGSQVQPHIETVGVIDLTQDVFLPLQQSHQL